MTGVLLCSDGDGTHLSSTNHSKIGCLLCVALGRGVGTCRHELCVCVSLSFAFDDLLVLAFDELVDDRA